MTILRFLNTCVVRPLIKRPGSGSQTVKTRSFCRMPENKLLWDCVTDEEAASIVRTTMCAGSAVYFTWYIFFAEHVGIHGWLERRKLKEMTGATLEEGTSLARD